MIRTTIGISRAASGWPIRRAVAVSVGAHLALASVLLAWSAWVGSATPQEPQVLAQVELVIGTNGEKAPPPSGDEAQQASPPPPGIADAALGPLAPAVAEPTDALQAAAPPPPAPAPDPAAAPAAILPPAPQAPPAPAKPVPKAQAAAARPRPNTTARQPTAPAKVDAPGRPPTEPVPMPDVRLDDGVSAPPAEILDSGSRLKPAESDTGNFAPKYPAEAARLHEVGTVVLKLHIDPTGRVDQVEITQSSGSRSLDRVSRERLATWHFHPALLNGQPIPSIFVQRLNFVDPSQ